MAEEKTTQKNEAKKEEKKVEAPKVVEKPKVEEKKVETKETKDSKEDKKEEKKVEAPKISKKDHAIARGQSLHLSKKHCMYICSFIKGKSIDKAISDLGEVIKYKKAIPFKGEIPHRKGKMMSGRYPVKAAQVFITMLRGLKGNVLVNSMELEKTKIKEASASWAARPMRSGGRQGKRTNVIIRAEESKPEEKK